MNLVSLTFFKSGSTNLFCLGIFLFAFLACSSNQEVAQTSEQTEQPSRWHRFKNIFDLASAKAKISESLPDFNADSLSILEKSETLFSLINGYDKSYYDSLLEAHNGEIYWDSLQRIELRYGTPGRQRDTTYQIFGWHPFWMGNAYKDYQFGLLSYVSWFSYDIDPNTGSYDNAKVISELKQTELIKEAKAKGCKVLLTITNHGREKTRTFLDNYSNQFNVLSDSVLHLVKTLGMDGIDVNFEFEDTKTGYGRQYTGFIKRLSNELKRENPDYTLSLTLQKLNNGRIHDISSLNDYVDIFVLTGYDFHYPGSKKDGPIAPLRSANGSLSLETIVENYLNEGVLEEKLILALPYYGAVWAGPKNAVRTTGNTFKRHLSYRSMQATYQKLGKPSYDDESESAYYLFRNQDNQYEKVWFDDSTTLKNKFDWIKNRNLAGVGIWALGYDNGRNELWNALDLSFAADTLVVLSIFTSEIFNVVSWLSDYQIPIFITALFYAFFVGLGFFISLFDWRVRNYLFGNKSSRLIFILSIFGIIAFIYMLILVFNNNYEKVWDNLNGSTALLVTGLLLGGVICGLIFKAYRKHRNNLP